MRVAVLGANGMLGARVVEELERANHLVFALKRQQGDLSNKDHVLNLAWTDVDWFVNCAGIVKSREAEAVQMVLVNSAAPHWLENEVMQRGEPPRILHVSTDCVFSGRGHLYLPTDEPDPVDLYGATKLAGELTGSQSITIRTSFIGWENATQRGLLEWFVRQKKVQGYANAFWSGLSAREVARSITRIVSHSPDLSCGRVYHITGSVISKLNLLRTLRDALELDVEIEEVFEPHIDRSLSPNIGAPSWEEMAAELAQERPK